MKTLTVAFIGHREIENIGRVVMLLRMAVEILIKKENAVTFLFTGKGTFDGLSYDVVTSLKMMKYPNLKRVYVRANYEVITEQYEAYLLECYDETYFPEKVKGSGYRAYVKRNQIMIDRCDVLVTCCKENYEVSDGKKSGTKAAVKYANQKNKRIIYVRDSE